MSDLTQAQINAQIALCNTALTNALTDPKPNYTVGSITVSHSQYMKDLRETLNDLRKMSASIPSEQVRDFDSEITDEGSDNTQYEGDSDQ